MTVIDARVRRTVASRAWLLAGRFYRPLNARIAAHCMLRCVRALHVEMRMDGGPWRAAW